MKFWLCCVTLTFFLVGNVFADPVPSTCPEAIQGTCAHFQYGDGAATGRYIVSGEPGGFDCVVTRASNSISCVFDQNNCPEVPPEGDGHNFPDVVSCEGCGDATSFSINEAKCCLIFGQPTNPATGTQYC